MASEAAEPEPTAEPEAEAEPKPEPEPKDEPEPKSTTIAERHDVSSTPAPVRTSMEDQASLRMQENADAANQDEVTPLSPGSPESSGKVKNWLKTKFSRHTSKDQKAIMDKDETADKDKGFLGGAALTGASESANNSTISLAAKSSTVTDAAMAETKGKSKEPAAEEPEERVGRSAHRDNEVSPLSSMEAEGGKKGEDEFQEARDNFDEGLAPPPTFPAEKSSSPVRDSKFVEEI